MYKFDYCIQVIILLGEGCAFDIFVFIFFILMKERSRDGENESA
jgi:hypothetical protein